MWQFNPREPDLTVMRVEVDATESEAGTRHIYDLLDYYDATTDTASMARTTGYTCTAMVRLVARGEYTKPGVSPPEYVGRETGCFEAVRKDLEARGIKLVETAEPS
jgi:saccharopine dehydrogenase-like NADP-dependent oxidoreductase